MVRLKASIPWMADDMRFKGLDLNLLVVLDALLT
ncbi:MAG: LysR family transcriptional regulator, partial [Mesorhizobium sp.]